MIPVPLGDRDAKKKLRMELFCQQQLSLSSSALQKRKLEMPPDAYDVPPYV